MDRKSKKDYSSTTTGISKSEFDYLLVLLEKCKETDHYARSGMVGGNGYYPPSHYTSCWSIVPKSKYNNDIDRIIKTLKDKINTPTRN